MNFEKALAHLKKNSEIIRLLVTGVTEEAAHLQPDTKHCTSLMNPGHQLTPKAG